MADIPPFPGKPLGDGYYLVSEEELKDAVLFRPGIPDFDDATTLPHKRVTKQTIFGLMDVIIFFDWMSTNEVDSSQCNQWAFVVDDRQALYVSGRVRSIPLGKVHELDQATVIKRFPEAVAKLIAPVLLGYRNNKMMFQVVVNHLMCNNLAPVLADQFFPPDVVYETDAEYEQAWAHLISVLEPRDAIFTFNRTSLMSKAIAKFTHGPFSHVAVHAQNGLISEVVTSGTRMVNIDVYKGRRFRVAAYRHYGKAPNTLGEMLAEMKAADGRPGHNYIGALKAGIKAYFGNHLDSYTPNSIILSGMLTFIAQA